MALKTNTNTEVSDALEKELKKLEISKMIRKYQESNPDASQEKLDRLKIIFDSQDELDYSRAIELV